MEYDNGLPSSSAALYPLAVDFHEWPSKHLSVQIHQIRHWSKMWNTLKVNNIFCPQFNNLFYIILSLFRSTFEPQNQTLFSLTATQRFWNMGKTKDTQSTENPSKLIVRKLWVLILTKPIRSVTWLYFCNEEFLFELSMSNESLWTITLKNKWTTLWIVIISTHPF